MEDIALLLKNTKFFGITENTVTQTLFKQNKQKIQRVEKKIMQDNIWQELFPKSMIK